MTPWHDWHQKLSALMGGFPEPEADFGPHPEKTFERWERENDKRIEVAIAQFVRQGAWPELPPRARLLLAMRLNFALHYTRSMIQLFPDPLPPLPRPEQRMLRWFLVELWDWTGFSTTAYSLAAVRPGPIAPGHKPGSPALN